VRQHLHPGYLIPPTRLIMVALDCDYRDAGLACLSKDVCRLDEGQWLQGGLVEKVACDQNRARVVFDAILNSAFKC